MRRGLVAASKGAGLCAMLALVVACKASAEAKSGDDAKTEEDDPDLVIERQKKAPAEDDPKTEDRTELMKREHRKCFQQAKEKHDSFKLEEYDITVTIRPNGTVSEVEVDESKMDVSHPSFTKCLTGRLKQLKFPPPKRELKAHLIFPD